MVRQQFGFLDKKAGEHRRPTVRFISPKIASRQFSCTPPDFV